MAQSQQQKQQYFLKELLKEDQEPFQLKDYIANRKSQLQKQSSLREPQQQRSILSKIKTQQQQIQVKKPKTISKTQSFPINFCKNTCFNFSNFHDSPDFRKSPLFEFPSPLPNNKSLLRGGGGSKSNPLFLHVPAKTANLLLEAATRIQQKQTSSSLQGSKKSSGSGFGLFGSMIKRLTHRKRGSSGGNGGAAADHNKELEKQKNNKVIVRWAGTTREVNQLRRNESEISGGRLSTSMRWTDDEEKDNNVNDINDNSCCTTATSTGCSGATTATTATTTTASNSSCNSSICLSTYYDEVVDDDEAIISANNYSKDFVNVLRTEQEDGDYVCLSPDVSPFRFALYRSNSPSPDHHQHHHSNRCSPVLSSSPARSSPNPRKFQDNVKYHEQSPVKYQGADEEDEEDRERNSPVSILDPPFADDDDEGHRHDDEDDGYDANCGYAFVQRAKQQLLHKLHRFEQLAELDPLELDKKMLEEYDVESEQDGEYEVEEEWMSSEAEERNVGGLVSQIMTKSCYQEVQKPGMKRLLSDIVTYEEDVPDKCDDDDEAAMALVKRVCQRLDSWKQVECNTIDMMFEMDLRTERDSWKNYREQIGETAMEIELDIFTVLVEELTEELV